MRYAIVKNEVVINVIEAELGIAEAIAAQNSAIAIQSNFVGIGYKYINNVFVPPAPALPNVYIKKLSKLAFTNRFTDAEYTAIIAAARESIQVEAWLKKFEMTSVEADGGSIDVTDERTIAGINALKVAGIIAPERIGAILAPAV